MRNNNWRGWSRDVRQGHLSDLKERIKKTAGYVRVPKPSKKGKQVGSAPPCIPKKHWGGGSAEGGSVLNGREKTGSASATPAKKTRRPRGGPRRLRGGGNRTRYWTKGGAPKTVECLSNIQRALSTWTAKLGGKCSRKRGVARLRGGGGGGGWETRRSKIHQSSGGRDHCRTTRQNRKRTCTDRKHR